ncbi:CRISPR-associated endonuclease Cas2 [Halosquirtibacter laminarini]|uniref:CRISPR-associated endonuclease Cas2 n=2 Tax=Halosquirtibacter laminarini TaxID=3374600 RepID=A0AC61NRD8_9BACT|nr:CRISPR-associated endonuclease Cas2 [Prolixibacteraceae bacterium]
MWIMVFFDLPTDTKTERKEAARFRKALLKDGFVMFQFSVYFRFCTCREMADLHIQRIKKVLPSKGKISILAVTDHQFGKMELFIGRKVDQSIERPQQLQLF